MQIIYTYIHYLLHNKTNFEMVLTLTVQRFFYTIIQSQNIIYDKFVEFYNNYFKKSY